MFYGIRDAKTIEDTLQTVLFADPFCYWLQNMGVNRMSNKKEVSFRVGIIGLGAVGSAVEHALNYYHTCAGYDIKGMGSWNNILKTAVSFICVSTPEGSDGRLDCSAVDNVLSRLNDSRYGGICVIKSTVAIGYTDAALKRFPLLRIVYMPEFLREKSNFTWFVNPDRIVVSGDESDIDAVLELFTWVDGLNENVPVLKVAHIEAEIGKLGHNARIATLVSFTNEMEQISQEYSADPEQVMKIIQTDRRVRSREHLRPGLGSYGGKCVPKDTRELINASQNTTLLEAAEQVNENLRRKELFPGSETVTSQSVDKRMC